jgi:hypothetical protein
VKGIQISREWGSFECAVLHLARSALSSVLRISLRIECDTCALRAPASSESPTRMRDANLSVSACDLGPLAT